MLTDTEKEFGYIIDNPGAEGFEAYLARCRKLDVLVE